MSYTLPHESFNRKQAYEFVLRKYHECEGNDYALAKLLMYFAPRIPATPKTAIDWIKQSVAVKDVREQMNYVHSFNGIAYGTNGHTARWANTDLPHGTYDPRTMLPSDKVELADKTLTNMREELTRGNWIPADELLNGKQWEKFGSLIMNGYGKDRKQEPATLYKIPAQKYAYQARWFDPLLSRNVRVNMENGWLTGECNFGEFVICPILND